MNYQVTATQVFNWGLTNYNFIQIANMNIIILFVAEKKTKKVLQADNVEEVHEDRELANDGPEAAADQQEENDNITLQGDEEEEVQCELPSGLTGMKYFNAHY